MLNGEEISSYGYGTYCLKVLLKSTEKKLALKLPTAGTSYDLYIADKKLVSVGKIGINQKETTPEFRPLIVECRPENGELNIVIHMSNYHYNYAGAWYPIILGRVDHIYQKRERSVTTAVFLIGIFFFSCVYHILLFLLRKSDTLPFYFACICLLIGLRQMCVDEIILLNLFPSLSFKWLLRMEYITFYAAVPLTAIYLKLVFDHEISKYAVWTINLLGITFLSLVLLTEVRIFSQSVGAYQAITLLMIVYAIYALIHAAFQKREGSLIILTGASVLFLTAINDMLYARQIIDTQYCVSFGLLFLSFHNRSL